MLKLEKWAPRALKGTLVEYDGHTIYRVHLKDQKKVILVKDLQIFQDYENKLSTELLDYSKDTPIFQDFFLADNNDEHLKANLNSIRTSQNAADAETNQFPLFCNKSRKVNEAQPILSKVIPTTSRGQKVVDAESR